MAAPGKGPHGGGLVAVSGPLARIARRLGDGPAPGRVAVAWSLAAGDRLGRRTRVIGLDGATLVVAVPDAAWADQLGALRVSLLRGLAGTLGNGTVAALRFEVHPGVVPAPRVEATRRAPSVTDAERRAVADAGVTDPVLAEAIARAMAAGRDR